MPNPSLIAATKNNAAIAAANTSATVTSTGGVTAGNLMVVMIEVAGAIAPSGITAPDGTWTAFLATTTTEASGLVSAAIFYKKATAGGAFSGAFSWTTASTGGEWSFTEWSGCGAALVDGTVGTTLNTSGTGPTSPAKTPGAGNVNDTLVCAVFGGVLSASTVTVPSGMTSILTVNGSVSQTLFGLASLNLASASATSAETWTLGTAQAVLGVSFLLQQGPVWGFDGGGAGHSNSITMPAVPPTRQRGTATKGRSEFAFYTPFTPMGWEVQPPPPPHPTPERRAAAIMRGDDGTEFKEIKYVDHGWPVQHVQPPHRAPEIKFAALARGDDGSEAKFVNWKNAGWEIQPPQPPRPQRKESILDDGDVGIEAAFSVFYPPGWEPGLPPPFHKRPENFGAMAKGDDGNENFFTFWHPVGWEPVLPPPPHPRPERSGAVMRGDDGIETTLGFKPFTTWGYDYYTDVRRSRSNRGSATKGKSDFVFWPPFATWGLDVYTDVKHPRPEKGNAVEVEPPVFFTPPVAQLHPYLFDLYVLPRSPLVKQRAAGAEGRDQFSAFALFPWWETPQPQPNHPTFRGGGIAVGDPGIESSFVVPPVLPVLGYEILPTLPHRFVKQPAPWDDGIAAPFAFFFREGWEPTLPPPPRQRWEKTGAFARGDDGSEAPFNFFVNEGWPVQPWQPPHPRPERAGAVLIGDPGNESGFNYWLNAGWEIQPPQPPAWPRVSQRYAGTKGTTSFAIFPNLLPMGWEVRPPQPPHRAPEIKFAALARGDDGTEGKFIVPFVNGWEVQPPQPPHPRPEKAAAGMIGDSGIEAAFIFNLPPVFWGFEQTNQPGKRYVYVPSTWDDGIQAAFSQYQPAGWEVAPPQLIYRPSNLKQAAFGDDGTTSPFAVWKNAGWEIQPPPPPHPRPERAGAVMIGDPGIEFTIVRAPLPSGWDVQISQPPHPRPERAGAVMRGDDGAEFTFQTWPLFGWDVMPPQPPHPRPERFGAVALGDPGTQSPFVFIYHYGWESILAPPYHHRLENAGALARWDDGIQGPFLISRPVGWEVHPPLTVHPRPERSGALAAGDQGTEAPFFVPRSLYLDTVLPNPVPTRFRRSGSLMIGESGIEGRLLHPFLPAFDPLPFVAHPQWQRQAAVAAFPFVEAPFIPPLVPIIPFGYDLPILPRWPRPVGWTSQVSWDVYSPFITAIYPNAARASDFASWVALALDRGPS